MLYKVMFKKHLSGKWKLDFPIGKRIYIKISENTKKKIQKFYSFMKLWYDQGFFKKFTNFDATFMAISKTIFINEVSFERYGRVPQIVARIYPEKAKKALGEFLCV